MGDVPLGLYALVKRIQGFIPNAAITFLIRKELKEVFLLFPGVDYICASWKRGEKYDVKKTLKDLSISLKDFDLILKKPDPTYWLSWQIGEVTPKLIWKKSFDDLHKRFLKKKKEYIGVQIESDTFHSTERDWKRWEELFDLMPDKKFILFGKGKGEEILRENIIDLRGKTSFLEVLSIIKNCCFAVVLPDGGILSCLYYLKENFPLKIISLWQDIQGILKQGVSSCNTLSSHIFLLSNKKKIGEIEPNQVKKYLC